MKIHELQMVALCYKLRNARVVRIEDWSNKSIRKRSQRPGERVITKKLQRKNLGQNDFVQLSEQKAHQVHAADARRKFRDGLQGRQIKGLPVPTTNRPGDSNSYRQNRQQAPNALPDEETLHCWRHEPQYENGAGAPYSRCN